MPRSAVLIHNPGSGQRRDRFHSITRMVDALRGRGVTVTPQVTTGPADATRLSAAALEAQADLVIVHGGDGTVNEAMQVLVGTSTPLAVWPGGTSNVLARELDLPGGIDLLADVIAAERTRRVSVGRAGERYFLLMAGVGLDADVVLSVRPMAQRLTGRRGLLDGRSPPARGLGTPLHFVLETDAGQHAPTSRLWATRGVLRRRPALRPGRRSWTTLARHLPFDSTQRHRFARYLPRHSRPRTGHARR